MVKLRMLRTEARRACEERDHVMNPFHRIDFWSPDKIQVSECRKCGRQVVVNTHPMPNEIDIGGEAVSVNCR